jgi:DNA-binding HxlR family transcriptional regulator
MSKRSYNQTCSVAGALDILGERWTLLVVRELLSGPKRYNDLLDGLSGIGTNLLAERLRALAGDGLITQRKLPRPAGVTVYELTEAGRALEPALLELVRWGMRHRRRVKKSAVYRATWTAVAMRAFFRPERAKDLKLACEFRVGDEMFHARVRDGELDTAAGPASEPDVRVTTTPAVFRRFEAGEDPKTLEKTGKWDVEGSKSALTKFAGLFEVGNWGGVERRAGG